MYLSEKEHALKQLLNEIMTLEEEISDIIVSYYIPSPIKINGVIANISLYDLMQMIIYDYKNIVLKDFYNNTNYNHVWSIEKTLKWF